MRRNIERGTLKTALIDKAWTPSYVSIVLRSFSKLAIPLQTPEKYRISPTDGRIGGLPQARN
jgi:hypothetical protein